MGCDPPASYRRAEHLVCYWKTNRFIIHNYAASTRIAVDPVLLRVLASADTWTTASDIARRFPGVETHVIQGALDELQRHSLLVRADRRPNGRDRALRRWEGWTPEAAFFHLAIRDTDFTPPEVADPAMREKALTDPPPAPVKKCPRAPVVRLPPAARSSPLARVLLQRRTWRRFASRSLTASHLATLLHLTWGVQHWVQPGNHSTKAALKTAPSGGARHSIEAYVLVRRVDGIKPGLYHYDPDAHRLCRLQRVRTLPKISDYVPHQTWYEPAAALVLMTAVFARAQWRYPYSRAYRAPFIEADYRPAMGDFPAGSLISL